MRSSSNHIKSLEAALHCYYSSNLRHPVRQLFNVKQQEITFGGVEKESRNISDAILTLNKRRANPPPNRKSKCWSN